MQIKDSKFVVDPKIARLGTFAVVLFIVFGTIIIVAYLWLAGEFRNWRDSVVFVVPGILMIVVPILIKFLWLDPRVKLFQGSSALAQAVVIDRKKEIVKASAGSASDFIGLLLEASFWMKSKISPFYAYYLFAQFEAMKPESGSDQVVLRIGVTKRVYDSHLPGSYVQLRYATYDPRLAMLESE